MTDFARMQTQASPVGQAYVAVISRSMLVMVPETALCGWPLSAVATVSSKDTNTGKRRQSIGDDGVVSVWSTNHKLSGSVTTRRCVRVKLTADRKHWIIIGMRTNVCLRMRVRPGGGPHAACRIHDCPCPAQWFAGGSPSQRVQRVRLVPP